MVLEKKQLSKAIAVLLTLAMMICGASIVTLCTTAKAYAATTYNVQTAIPDQTWTGEVPDLMAEPALDTIKVSVQNNPNRTLTLKKDVDFTVVADSSSVGTANAIFTAIGDYAGDTINSKAFNIVEDVPAATYAATVDPSMFVYDGTALNAAKVEAATTVMKNDIENIYMGNGANEYSVAISPATAVNAGDKAKVTITINALSGDAAKVYEEEVTILPFDLAKAKSITGKQQEPTFVYDGTAKEATFNDLTVAIDNAHEVTLPKANYDITGYQDNVNATTASAKAKALVKAKSTDANKNFTGEGAVEFEIEQFDLSGAYVQQTEKPSVVFNGEVQNPALNLVVTTSNTYGAKVIPAEEYTVNYPDSVNAGEYEVEITAAKANGNYTYRKYVSGAYQITPANLKDAVFTQTNAIEAGEQLNAGNILKYFDVTVNGYKLKQADVNGMTVTQGSNYGKAGQTVNVSLAVVEGTNLTGTGSTTYVTAAKSLAPVYQAQAVTFTYDGTEQVPVASKLGTLTVKGGTDTITTADYDVTGNWKNNVNAGDFTATATIQGKGEYAGEAVVEFTIDPQKLDPAAYTAKVTGIPTGTYFEGAVIDSAVVTLTPAVALAKTDYVVTAKTFNAEQSKLTQVEIALQGNYAWTEGTKTAAVDVVSNVAQLKDAVITGTVPAGLATYDADAVKRYITVTVGNVEATPAAYNLTITNASAADFGKVGTKIKFDLTSKVPQLIGEKTGCEVEVTPRDIAELQPAAIDAMTYTGAALTPAVTLSDPAGYAAPTAVGTDYTVTYDKNIDAGTAEVTITGKGNYTGTTTTAFVIDKASLTYQTDFVLVVPDDVDAQYRPVPTDESAKLSIKAADGQTFQFTPDDYEIAINPNQTFRPVGRPIRYTLTIKESSNNYVPNTYTVSYDCVPRQVGSADANITIAQTQFEVGTFDRHDLEPITVVVDGQELAVRYDSHSGSIGASYTVEGNTSVVTSDVPEAEKPSVLFKFRNNYTGQARVPITIVPKVININEVQLLAPSAAQSAYTGSAVAVTEVDSGKNRLVSGNAENHYYDVVYKDAEGKVLPGAPTEVGTYTATVVATERYGGEEGVTIPFSVNPKTLSAAEFKNMTDQLSVDGDVEYLGDDTLAPALSGAEADQFEAVEWDKTWDGDAANKGKATIALKEGANYVYAGTATIEYTWEPGTIYWDDVNDYFEIPDQVYTGKAIEPAVQVKEGCEFSIDWLTVKYYENNVNAAKQTAKVYVTVESPDTEKRYKVDLDGFVVFTIKPAPIADQTIKVAKATYAGKAVTPKVTVTDADGAVLTLDKDYKVAYKNNKKAGKGTATITGIKNYTGTTDVQFTIAKGKQKIAKVTPATKTYKANKKGTLAAKKTFKLKAKATPKKGGGKVTFKKANKAGKAKIKVAKNGKVTVKKGLKKGTYKVKVKVTKAGNANYKKATKKVTIKIVVK